jgi:3-methylfumaryl-CoA hydratase
MADWDDWIGRTVTQQDQLTPALLRRFRATIDSDETSDIAPQAIHWALCTPEAATAQLGLDGHPQRSENANSFLPPLPFPRRMWASSEVEFIRPLAINADIQRVSTIAAIDEKDGSTGKLVFVKVMHKTQANGQLATREAQTLVYREASAAAPIPAPPIITPDFSQWHFHRTITPNEALLFRFSAITFNTHRIHYDAPYAIHEERYRGIVVHGPLMASLLLDLAARNYGANALASFAFRAQAPAFANEPLHLVGRFENNLLTMAALGSDGRLCMSADATLGPVENRVNQSPRTIFVIPA